MKTTKTSPKINWNANLILLLPWFAYLLSYLGRANYGACILEIVTETGTARSVAGMVSATLSICYSIGQLVNGLLVQKTSPVKVIKYELFAVALINFLFPATDSFALKIVLWAINGCVQSVLLCGVTKIYVENLEEPYLSRSAVIINTVGAFGGVANYVITYFALRFSRWQTVFYVAFALLFTLAILWTIFMPKLTSGSTATVSEPKKTDTSSKKQSSATSNNGLLYQLSRNGAFIAIIGCVAIGFLREGMSLWIPSYISDAFAMEAASSTLMTVFVPLFQVSGAFLAGYIGRQIHNLHFPACILFAVSACCMVLLLLVGGLHPALSILFFGMNAISMTATLTIYLSMFPLRFYDRAYSASIVGLSNFCSHLGEFMATSGIGWISEHGGWGVTFGALASFALLASCLSIIGGTLCRKERTS